MGIPASHITDKCRPSGHHPAPPRWHLGPASPFRLKSQGLCLPGSSPSSHPHFPTPAPGAEQPQTQALQPRPRMASAMGSSGGGQLRTQPAFPAPPHNMHMSTSHLRSCGTLPGMQVQILPSSPCPEQPHTHSSLPQAPPKRLVSSPISWKLQQSLPPRPAACPERWMGHVHSTLSVPLSTQARAAHP